MARVRLIAFSVFCIALAATTATAAMACAKRPGTVPAAAKAGQPLAGKTIVIDPGHNGGNAAHPQEINKQVPAGGFMKACDTTGTATNDGALSESAFNWDLAKRLTRLLRRAGATVVLTRHNDRGVGPCINQRAAIGNRAKADVAISLHADGGPPSGHGFHVIRPGLVRGYTGPIIGRSKTLAADVRDRLVRAGLTTSTYIGRNGIDIRTDLGGLNLSKIPKVFLETGNMRNAGDAARLENKRWREHTAAALRDALATYLAR